jgi:UDP-GlcNAc:undecaprenyl-phosphate GlcNAc-1-phosphate transferase
MYAGIFLGICIAMGTSGNSVYLLAAGALLIMVGVLDDWRGLPCIPRLLAEITAALIMIIGGGLVITDIGNPFGFGIIQTGPVGILVSVLITVSVINAFNFIDGIDGLAGSMALVALLAGATASGWASPTVSIATVACAAIIGFLFFNLPMQGRYRLSQGSGLLSCHWRISLPASYGESQADVRRSTVAVIISTTPCYEVGSRRNRPSLS